MPDNPEHKSKARSMTKQELANEYNICAKTLNTWLERAEIDVPKYAKRLTPVQVAEVFQKIGEP